MSENCVMRVIKRAAGSLRRRPRRQLALTEKDGERGRRVGVEEEELEKRTQKKGKEREEGERNLPLSPLLLPCLHPLSLSLSLSPPVFQFILLLPPSSLDCDEGMGPRSLLLCAAAAGGGDDDSEGEDG